MKWETETCPLSLSPWNLTTPTHSTVTRNLHKRFFLPDVTEAFDTLESVSHFWLDKHPARLQVVGYLLDWILRYSEEQQRSIKKDWVKVQIKNPVMSKQKFYNVYQQRNNDMINRPRRNYMMVMNNSNYIHMFWLLHSEHKSFFWQE